MNNALKSPIDNLNDDQSSQISQSPYRQAEMPYQMPKIDHAFIVENYRRLRMHQRDQLARLRMPDKLKRKIFNFKQDQDLKYEKPELVIFNHPFRGKTVMTREQVEKQLQRERRNAQCMGDQRQPKGEKVQQDFLNEMGLSQEHVTVKKARMERQQSSKGSDGNRSKPDLVSKQKQKDIAQEINKKQQQKLKGNIYFLQKQKGKQETEKQRTQKMKKLIREKQDSSQKNGYQKSQQKSRDNKRTKSKQFRDMPIIGEQPKVVRDIRFQDVNVYEKSKGDELKVKTKENVKEYYYRPFGNESQMRNVERGRGEYEYQPRDSGDGLIKKRRDGNGKFENELNKSISEISAISAIESKNEEDDLSNSQSLNKALFMN